MGRLGAGGMGGGLSLMELTASYAESSRDTVFMRHQLYWRGFIVMLLSLGHPGLLIGFVISALYGVKIKFVHMCPKMSYSMSWFK